MLLRGPPPLPPSSGSSSSSSRSPPQRRRHRCVTRRGAISGTPSPAAGIAAAAGARRGGAPGAPARSHGRGAGVASRTIPMPEASGPGPGSEVSPPMEDRVIGRLSSTWKGRTHTPSLLSLHDGDGPEVDAPFLGMLRWSQRGFLREEMLWFTIIHSSFPSSGLFCFIK